MISYSKPCAALPSSAAAVVLALCLSAGCTVGTSLPEEREESAATSVAAAVTSGMAAPSTTTTPPTDANTVVAPKTDGDTEAGSPSPATPFNCSQDRYAVCDGFETVAPGKPPDPLRWDSNVRLPTLNDDAVHNDHPDENVIEVSDKMAHTGKQSLHLHSSRGWAHLPIEAITSKAFPKAFFPAPRNTFFVRLWLFNDGLAGDHGVSVASGHWYLVNASGPLGGRQQYQKFGGGGATLGWNYFGNDEGLGSNSALPSGEWVCYEVQFKGDSNELFVWRNDQPVDSLHATKWAAPDYNRLTIGWEMDHPDGGYPGNDVYLDDVAFSYTRIGCAVTTS